MSREPLHRRIGKGTLLLDGAMGTQLFERGIEPGGCNEKLCLDRPEVVTAVHQAYLDAGCNSILTNSFGANAISLARHGVGADQIHSINVAAAQLARKAAGEDRYVFGDIGPTGDFLAPLGTLTEVDLQAAFAAQAKALDEGGVDGFIIETMTALDELVVAVKAIKSVSTRPVLASMSFDPVPDAPKTMMGVSPRMMVDKLLSSGVHAVGFNCGTLDMNGYLALAEAFRSALFGTNIRWLAEPNAGKPELRDGKAVYTLSPEEYAKTLVEIRNMGCSIIGGCCGTSPAHLAAAAKAMK
jgi:5-methyltetrahydrofolate--homocysteine methyltransferase